MLENGFIRNVVACNIKKYRKLNNLTQEKLAELSNMSNTYIANIECGKTWVSDKTLESIAAALNTDIFMLFIPTGYSSQLSDSQIQTVIKNVNSCKNEIYDSVEKIIDNTLKKIRKELSDHT